MISRRTRVQLVAFIVLAVVGVVYVGGKYAGLERVFTSTRYTVAMHLEESGGIFTNAEVTYQGVTVGRVGELRPTDDGVVVDLLVDRDAEPIPEKGLRATIKNLSAIGEPYVDLEAESEAEPYLGDGSTIPAERTRTPVPPARLLASLNDLLESVPQDSVRTVLRELDRGFSGTGPDLARLLDNSSQLVDAATAALPETTRLIRDGTTVLRTQNDAADSITSFSRDLRSLAGQLERSDRDIRRLLETGPTLATEAISLLQESGPGLSQLVADLLTVGRLAEPRNQALRQLLITYPALARAAYSAVPGDGTVHFGLVLNAFDPPPCTRGYESTPRRSGTETRDIPVNDKATCAEPTGSPRTVRGSQNAPRAGVAPKATAPEDGGVAADQGSNTTTAPAVTPAALEQLVRLLGQRSARMVDDPTQILLPSSVGNGGEGADR